MKIEKAPDSSIKFLEMIIDFLVIEVLGIEGGYLVTDESYLDDFRFKRSSNCEFRDNKWFFKTKMLDKKALIADFGENGLKQPFRVRKKYFKEVIYEVEEDDISKDEDVVNKIKEIFDVVVEKEDLNLKVNEIAYKISSQISDEKRIELKNKHNLIIN